MLAHYTNKFRITFTPNEYVCDYIDVEKWIQENLNDEKLIIEDAVTKLFDYINNTYAPKSLKVESYVDDAIHGPVTVVTEEN